MEKVLDMFHSDYLSFSPTRSISGFSLKSLPFRKPVQFPGGKSYESVESPSYLVARNFLLSYSTILSLQQFVKTTKCSYRFMVSMASAPGKQILVVPLRVHLSVWISSWWFVP